MKRVLLFSGILAVIAIALGTWLALDKPKPKAPEENWQPAPLAPKDATVAEVTLITPARTIKFTYNERFNAYVMNADGKNYLTDKIMADRVISALMGLERKKLIALEPADLAIYNLKTPMLSLIIQFSNDEPPLQLDVGKENYTHDALFAKIKDKPTVFLIPPDIATFIDIEPKAFRTRSLLYSLPMDVASIEIKIHDPAMKASLPEALEPKLVVQKQVQGQRPEWMIVAPVSENAAFRKVDAFFNQLRLNDAQDILDVKKEGLAELGLNPPRAEIIITNFKGEQQRVFFGNEKDGLIYAMNSVMPEVLRIQPAQMMMLLLFSGRKETPVAERREILPTSVLVEYPRDSQPAMQLNLGPDKKSYAVAGQPEKNVLLSRIRRILKPLREGKIIFIRHQEPYDRAAYGVEKPRMRVRMQEGDAVEVEVAVGNTTTLNETTFTYVEDLRRKCVIAIQGDILTEIPYGDKEFTAPPKARKENEPK